MASDFSRSTAKEGISEREKSDPELDAALKDGTRLQLELLKESNRHDEENSRTQLGLIGGAFGGERNAPAAIALIAMLFGLIGWIGALVLAAVYPEAAEFWAKNGERALSFAATALAFIFGRGSKST
jgi:hypothetical protein